MKTLSLCAPALLPCAGARMPTHLFNFETLGSLITLTVLETVLGIDNIIFLTILVGKLPLPQQPMARRLGLVLALGLEERRRTLAIASALGAKPRQLASFVWSEAGLILTGGLLGGLSLGWGVAQVLTKLLTHVFDPPPLAMTVPWPYLALLVGVTVASVAVAGQIVNRIARRDVLETIRRL